MSQWTIEIENFETLKAVYIHALTDTPEEDAWKTIQTWAITQGLLNKQKGTRVFGRNTYPTNNPEPHGYELYITVKEPTTVKGDLKKGEIPGGLYAVLKSTNIKGFTHSWPQLWRWLEESQYKFIGWDKSENGWVNGFEEYLNPFNELPQSEWLFNLMIPVIKK
jgi:DNA gyrase inhibitor GyrI